MVARDAPGARRHRRAGLRDHPAPAHLGGLRPPRELHRPARRLPHLQAALPRRPLDQLACGTQAVEASRRVRRLRPDRGARLQPDVRDDCRPGQGDGLDGLPAPGDRAGHLRQLQERACSSRARSRRSGSRRSASRSATRSRPATSSSARASSSRWRWSSSSRRPRPSSGSSYWLARAARLVPASSGSAPTTCACARTTPTSSRTTRAQTSDVEYLFPIGWSELEGIANRGDFDLRQHAEYSGQTLEYFDQQTGERYVPHVIEPAAGADRATLAFLVDAYDEEEVEGEHAHRAAPAPAPRAGQGRGPAAAAQGRAARARTRGLCTRCASVHPGRVRRGRLDRPALPPPGRDRHALVRDDRPRVASATAPSPLRDRDTLAQERIAIDELADELARRVQASWKSPKLKP